MLFTSTKLADSGRKVWSCLLIYCVAPWPWSFYQQGPWQETWQNCEIQLYIVLQSQANTYLFSRHILLVLQTGGNYSWAKLSSVGLYISMTGYLLKLLLDIFYKSWCQQLMFEIRDFFIINLKLISTIKNHAYKRHWISRRVRLVAWILTLKVIVR